MWFGGEGVVVVAVVVAVAVAAAVAAAVIVVVVVAAAAVVVVVVVVAAAIVMLMLVLVFSFSTSERPKVVRYRQFLTLLTRECDSRMCFTPHRRVLFQHLNFQKCSESDVFCAFWLREVLRTATTCTFSTAQRPEVVWSWGACDIWLQTVLPATVPSIFPTSPLPKVAQSCGLLNIFSSKSACGIWPNGSAPAALASLLFNRPGPQNIWKAVFCDFSTFSRACMFFLLTLSLLWSSFFFLSLWLFPALLFLSVHIVGSLTSS